MLTEEVIEDVVARVERLRARGIAARYTEITGKLHEEVKSIGARVVGVGAYRTLAIELQDGTEAWAYPVVGVPTAVVMNSIATRAKNAEHKGPFLVYDHSGIAEPWLDHLKWLDDYIPEVDFMRVSDAGQTLQKRAGSK